VIRKALHLAAGVDPETLARCPASDRMWATHLGFSLCLSFVVVFGVSLYAIAYFVTDTWIRVGVALVVALTVFMFDRALYQSDWFYQGVLWPRRGDANGGGRRGSFSRFARVGIRIGISICLASVIAIFLELAVFSDTITQKIKQDHLRVNGPVYQKIEQYERELADDIARRRKDLAALEAQYRDELARSPVADAARTPEPGALTAPIAALDTQEGALNAELRQVQETIRNHSIDMNAEALGKRVNESNSGRAGTGPRYEFAKRQKEVFETQRLSLERELTQIRARRDEIRQAEAQAAAELAARRNREESAIQARHEALQSTVTNARADVAQREATRLLKLEEFKANVFASSDFQRQKDDPLSRMTAYQELKEDPKDGATIVLFSWMTKLFVIFLEIVPVLAKVFFSPPSAYAALLQAEVDRARDREHDQDLPKPYQRIPSLGFEPEPPEIVPKVRRPAPTSPRIIQTAL
jgi:hypothetical protein